MVLERGCDAERQRAQNDCACEVPACTRGLRARIASADWFALLRSIALSTVILISLRLPPNAPSCYLMLCVLLPIALHAAECPILLPYALRVAAKCPVLLPYISACCCRLLCMPPNVLSFRLISLRVAADCSACRRMPHPVTLCSACCRRLLCIPLRLDSATCVFQHRARALNSLTASSN